MPFCAGSKAAELAGTGFRPLAVRRHDRPILVPRSAAAARHEKDGSGQRRPPTVVTDLILMEIADPFMMRKWLLGIKQRAERLAADRRRRIAGTAAKHGPEVRKQSGRGKEATRDEPSCR